MTIRKKYILSYAAALLACQGSGATEVLSVVEVRARAENLEGIAAAASEGVVSSPRLAALPMLRPGEALELVPGLVATQHAGDGKANQYFLRGFNLDHGTDFATWVGGVPVNMPSHAHGQGYTDLNFLIPELIERVRYRKGPYFAEEGDFSSAGAAHIDYFRTLDGTLAQLTLGRNGYGRSLLAGAPSLGTGNLLYALEVFHNDGPWAVAENYRKLNAVLRYSEGSRDDGWSVTGMAYRGGWTSTDQVAQRAIDQGIVGRYGSLDPTAGGRTFRYSLAADWARRSAASQTRASLWGLRSGLDLWSNFTYCLNDYASSGTCADGDQFKQAERRTAGGFTVSHSVSSQWGGRDVLTSVGMQGRLDRIGPLGLYTSRQRDTLATTREDRVNQRSLALWTQQEIQWVPWLRSIVGLRGDSYAFDVAASQAANAGQASDQLVTPKFSLVVGPWRRSELYLNAGHGFHSNDARGATIRQVPGGTDPAERVRPLIRTRGEEIGVRSEVLPGWQTTLAVWQLRAASELLFVGDAGTTEASRPSWRRGVEWNNFYAVTDWLAVDADLSWSQARFRDDSAAGRHIPGAVAATANLGVSVDRLGRWFGALRVRYVGARPLVEDNSVRAPASALTNLRVGYRWTPGAQLALDVFNLFDRKVNDIEYWYCSRLPGEAASAQGCADGTAGGYDDRHVHPSEPRSLRLTFSYRF